MNRPTPVASAILVDEHPWGEIVLGGVGNVPVSELPDKLG